MSESFGRDINRFHKLPAINDNGFVLSESVAIFHYLGRKGILSNRWYPSDLKTLTRIDEYLQWQHNNLFIGAGTLFIKLWVVPLTTGVKPTAEQIERHKQTLIKNLDDLQNFWLKDSKFLTGNEIAFSDLMAASLLEQVIGLGLFQLDERHSKIQVWIELVRQHFGSSFNKAHQFAYKFGKTVKPIAD